MFIIVTLLFFADEIKPLEVEEEVKVEVVDETSVEEDIVEADSPPTSKLLLRVSVSVHLPTDPLLLLLSLLVLVLVLLRDCCWDSMAIRLTDTRAAEAGRSGLKTALRSAEFLRLDKEPATDDSEVSITLVVPAEAAAEWDDSGATGSWFREKEEDEQDSTSPDVERNEDPSTPSDEEE